jgi:hypothetical protein
MVDFTIQWSDGTVATSEVAESFSGTMVIYPDNYLRQTLCIKLPGYDNRCSQGGGWIEGANIISNYNGCEIEIPFTYENYIFTTTIPMGECGTNYSETDVWVKVSDTIGERSLVAVEAAGKAGAIMGTLID